MFAVVTFKFWLPLYARLLYVLYISDAYMTHAYIDGGIQVVAPALGAPICLCCIGSDYTY